MLIFLDIDGVMVPAKAWKVPENMDDGFPMFSEKATAALKRLISPDTKVILSTSHRDRFGIDIWKKIFERRGLRIENLSRLESNENLAKKRKDEILGWFNRHEVKDNFIIIDDDTTLNSLPEHLKRNLILTSSSVGLTFENLSQVHVTLP
jgi:hypothetical protein